MTVLLYRPSLDVDSGAAQLILTQWRALRARNISVELGCERGRLKLALRTGALARRLSPAGASLLQREGARFVVDHGPCVPGAKLVFVHNVAAEASLHVERTDWAPRLAAERAFFGDLAPDALVIANSQLAKAALCKHFGLAPACVIVHRPGFSSARFTVARAAAVRAATRRNLEVDDRTLLVGFVTSGDFGKRGLDLFLASALEIAQARPDVRFLVVGSKELPPDARQHALVERRLLRYRPKGPQPERWFAALDLFLYAARFEEFGMVVAEAQAMGVPIVTSRVVGATESLASAYRPWLLDRPEPAELADRSLALLADDQRRRELALAGVAHAQSVDDREYARATVETILAQKRRLK